MKLKGLVFALFMLGIGVTVNAQTTTPGVKSRQIKQQKRIHQGVVSGELTRKETVVLQKQQLSVQKQKKAAKADGVVTARERAAIHRHQTKVSKNIHRQKNDGQTR